MVRREGEICKRDKLMEGLVWSYWLNNVPKVLVLAGTRRAKKYVMLI